VVRVPRRSHHNRPCGIVRPIFHSQTCHDGGELVLEINVVVSQWQIILLFHASLPTTQNRDLSAFYPQPSCILHSEVMNRDASYVLPHTLHNPNTISHSWVLCSARKYSYHRRRRLAGQITLSSPVHEELNTPPYL